METADVVVMIANTEFIRQMHFHLHLFTLTPFHIMFIRNLAIPHSFLLRYFKYASTHGLETQLCFASS